MPTHWDEMENEYTGKHDHEYMGQEWCFDSDQGHSNNGEAQSNQQNR